MFFRLPAFWKMKIGTGKMFFIVPETNYGPARQYYLRKIVFQSSSILKIENRRWKDVCQLSSDWTLDNLERHI
jgi:hypothetical protein